MDKKSGFHYCTMGYLGRKDLRLLCTVAKLSPASASAGLRLALIPLSYNQVLVAQWENS